MENKDIFKKACLVQFSTSVWQSSRVLDQSILADRLGQDVEWLRGRKFLINPELLGPIKTAVHQARNHIQKFALPFPITSIYLIPKDSLEIVDERLNHFKERFWNKVSDFEALYEVGREEAQTVLKDLFNETDYPTDIRSKFRFEWRYLTLGIPGKAHLLTPDIYEREKEKFQDLMEETRELSMIAIREGFAQVVDHLVERLGGNNGKPKVLTNKLFNKLNEFIDDLELKNIFEDKTLTELAQQAREIIGGISPYSLKYSKDLREKVREDMESVKSAIDAAIEDMPRRKIRLDTMAI